MDRALMMDGQWTGSDTGDRAMDRVLTPGRAMRQGAEQRTRL